MLSGAVDWNALEEQLVNSRTSSDKIREKVFDFAISQREVLREKQHQVGGVELRGGVESHSVVGYQTWMTSSGVGSQDITHQDRIARMHHQDSTHQQDRGVRTRRDISNMRDWFQSWLNTKRSHERSQLHWDTVSTLGAVLDLSTHLHNYPTPIAPELARFVAAKQDRYIPRDRIINVQQAWPGKRELVLGVLLAQCFSSALGTMLPVVLSWVLLKSLLPSNETSHCLDRPTT